MPLASLLGVKINIKSLLQHHRPPNWQTLTWICTFTSVTSETPATNQPYTPIFSRPCTSRTRHLTTLYSAGDRCPCSLYSHTGQYAAPPSHAVANTFITLADSQSIASLFSTACSATADLPTSPFLTCHLCSPILTSKQRPIYELSHGENRAPVFGLYECLCRTPPFLANHHRLSPNTDVKEMEKYALLLVHSESYIRGQHRLDG